MSADNALPESFKGVFSTALVLWIGTGATKRKTSKDVLVYAEERQDGTVKTQELNDAFIPSGLVRIVKREDFVAKYKPESAIYTSKTIPALRQLQKTIAKAERLRAQGEPYSAEFEFQNALKLDDKNIRALFGLGLNYLDRGENDRANELLQQLVVLEETFDPENKHLFNEFGIKLRKNGMLDQALSYYARAFKLSSDDEHLCYNIARTLYDKNDIIKAAKFLKKALMINRSFAPALEFLTIIKRRLLRDKTLAEKNG